MCANGPVCSPIPIHSYSTWQQLVQPINNDNFNINLGVLETAHSIFRSWRSQARSDAFWSIIKLVHSKFLAPYFALFQLTISRLLATPDPLLAQTMAVLVELFYDLTCQDLAPEFEDSNERFFAAETGYFMQLMEWNPPQLHTDVRILGAPSRRDTELLLARRTYALDSFQDPHSCSRDRRGAPPPFISFSVYA
jgi:exportin-2 (importin alpha re-exporter)